MPHIPSVSNPPAIDPTDGMDNANWQAITNGLPFKVAKVDNISQIATDQALRQNLDLKNTAKSLGYRSQYNNLTPQQRFDIGFAHHLRHKAGKIPTQGNNSNVYVAKKYSAQDVPNFAENREGWMEYSVQMRSVGQQQMDLTRELLQRNVLRRVAINVAATTGNNPLSWRETYKITSKTTVFRMTLSNLVEQIIAAENEIRGVKGEIIAYRQGVMNLVGSIIGVGLTIGVPFPAGVIAATGVRALLAGKDPMSILGETTASYFETGAVHLADTSSGKSVLDIAGYNSQDPKWLKENIKGVGGSFGQIYPGAAKKYQSFWQEKVLLGCKLPDINPGSLSITLHNTLDFAMTAIDAMNEAAFDDLKSPRGCAPIVLACWSRFRPSLLLSLFDNAQRFNKDYAFQQFEADLTQYVRAYIRRVASNHSRQIEDSVNALQRSHLATVNQKVAKQQAAKVLWAIFLSNPKYHQTYHAVAKYRNFGITYRIAGLHRMYYEKMAAHGLLEQTSQADDKYAWDVGLRRRIPIEKKRFYSYSLGDGAKYRVAAWQSEFMHQFMQSTQLPSQGLRQVLPLLMFMLDQSGTRMLLE